MRIINHAGKSITLKLTPAEAAVVTEALRKYGSEESLKMVEKMMNGQEVLPGKVGKS